MDDGFLNASRRLATPLLQLRLPPQHSRLVPLRLRLRYHTLLLIQNRKARMRQDIVRINLRNLLRHFNGLVKSAQILKRPAQPVQRIRKLRIRLYRMTVLFHRLIVLSLQHQIKRGVLVMFSELASVGLAGRILRHGNRLT